MADPPPWLLEKGPPTMGSRKCQAHGVLLPLLSHPLEETPGHPSPREGERPHLGLHVRQAVTPSALWLLRCARGITLPTQGH